MKFVFVFSLFVLPSLVFSHGFQSWPRPRGLLGNNNFGLKVLAPEANSDYCPHCLNGGGVGMIRENIPNGIWTPYEPTDPNFPFRDDHEVCGDPKNRNDHIAPNGIFYEGKTIATYEEGDYMDMEMYVNAHHNGFFEYFICSLDCCEENDVSKSCFQKGCCHKLMRVPHKSCESGDDRICGPVDSNYPGRWYLPPRDQEDPENIWYGGSNKKMRYALPKGFTCEKCVLHWSWTTANSCNPPGYAEYNFPQRWDGIPGDGGSLGSINRQFQICGDSTTAFPEEFWSCSENIKIVKKDDGKSRTLQIFRDSDMNIEGPDDSTSSQLLEPLKEPEHSNEANNQKDEVVVTAIPTKTPQPSPEYNNENNENNQPQPQPSKETSLPQEDYKEGEKDEKYPSPIPLQTEGSKYNIGAYIRAYDTGICVAGKNQKSYCEACLDLGYGSTKCLWCYRSDDGKENCTHQKPGKQY